MAAALSLPAVLTGLLRRPRPPGWRAACVVLFAAAGTLAVGLAEIETARLRGSSRARHPFHDSAFGRWYGAAAQEGMQARVRLDDRFASHGWLVNITCADRTRLTGATFLLAAAAGCVLFRPWRRGEPDPEPVSPPAPPAPPAAGSCPPTAAG